MRDDAAPTPATNRWLAFLLAAVAVSLVVVQYRATRTENINWDEFALLARAQESIQSGTLSGAGRPGLASLILVPLVRSCSDSVETVIRARAVWLGFTLTYLAGVFALARSVVPERRHAWEAAAASVALLAAVPVFLRWSLQVRSDQPALGLAVWGAVLLLAASRRVALALPAGALFALGYLCSQKAAYVGVLACTLVALRLTPKLELRAAAWRRGLAVLALAAVAALATVVAFNAALSFTMRPSPSTTIEAGLDTFAYYRAMFGYRAYRAMLPSLSAHGLLIALLFAALIVSGRRALASRAQLVTCWVVLLLGFAVGAFHAGAFPYFWMTLGLFPAVAIGVGLPAVFEAFGDGVGRTTVAAAALLLAVHALPAARTLQEDTVRVQRDAQAFIARNFASDARGFHADGGLFCRPDPKPFPTYFAESVARAKAGDRAGSGRSRFNAFIDEFRARPVQFMIVPRVTHFPPDVEAFWAEHYVRYRDEVMVPGRGVNGARGDVVAFDVIVPGRYRWIPPAGQRIAVDVDGVALAGAPVTLAAGPHQLALGGEVRDGMFVMALDDDPLPEGMLYYSPSAIRELDPLYPRFRR